MKRFIAILIVFSLALGGLIWYGTQQNDDSQTVDSDVVVTIYPIHDITQNIAGDALEVTLLLSPGASPHTFEPSPKDLRTIQRSKVMYGVGHGLDNWAFKLAGGSTEVHTVDTKIDVRAQSKNETHADDEENEHTDAHNHQDEDGHEHEDEQEGAKEDHDNDEHAHEHGPTDPHYWLSMDNGAQIARNITNDLTQRFPEKADTFEANLDAYLQELAAADQEVTETIEQDVENRNLITLHDAWYYFANDYNLNIVGTFEPSAGREPTPQYLIRLTDALKEASVTTIYSEPQIPTSSLDSFVQDNDLTIAELDPLGGVEGRESYIEMMKYNARTIAQNQ